MARTSSVTMPNGGAGTSPLRGRGGKKVRCLLLFVCRSHSLNSKFCADDFVVKAFEYRSDFGTIG